MKWITDATDVATSNFVGCTRCICGTPDSRGNANASFVSLDTERRIACVKEI